MTDEQLFIAGDVAALRAKYDGPLLNTLGRKIGTKAKQVLDDTWAHLERYRNNYEPTLCLRSWLFTVAFRRMKEIQKSLRDAE